MATKLNLEDLNPGSWFIYGKPEDETKIKMRVCAGNDFRTIQKATTTEKYDNRRIDGKMERVLTKKVDEELQMDMIWDFCIVAWEGLVDASGVAIPCTKENKLLLMGKSVKFAAFVSEKLQELREIETDLEKASEKN